MMKNAHKNNGDWLPKYFNECKVPPDKLAFQLQQYMVKLSERLASIYSHGEAYEVIVQALSF